MNFDNMNSNNNFNDGFDEARRIIAEAQRFRPTSACCIPPNNGGGTVGPTGPTERLFKSSNRIIIDSS